MFRTGFQAPGHDDDTAVRTVISPLHADRPIDRAFCLTLRGYKGRGSGGQPPLWPALVALPFWPALPALSPLPLCIFADLQPQERPCPKAHCLMQDTL